MKYGGPDEVKKLLFCKFLNFYSINPKKMGGPPA